MLFKFLLAASSLILSIAAWFVPGEKIGLVLILVGLAISFITNKIVDQNSWSRVLSGFGMLGAFFSLAKIIIGM